MSYRAKKKDDAERFPEEQLSPLERRTRKLAIAVAFASVFYFMVKLLFLQ
jgi:hypothetical protein